MRVDIIMPQLGESVVEGTITKWLVRPGDQVRRDQAVVEVATDKADSEVPTSQAGRIVSILVAEGAVAKVGQPLCVLETEVSAQASAPEAPAAPSPPASPSQPTSSAPPREAYPSVTTSPATRRLAREHGVDLAAILGSGERGRVTRDDVIRAAGLDPETARQPPARAPQVVNAAVPAPLPSPSRATQEIADLLSPAGYVPPIPGVGFGSFKPAPYVPHEGDQIIPFTRRRRLIADHMVYSKAVSPQVVTVAEIDVDRTHRLRDQHKAAFQAEGIGLTMLAFVCAAVIRALGEYPGLNARVLDDRYVILRDINLGIAVDTAEGLLVPCLKRAAELSLRGIARALGELAGRARAGTLTPEELTGSSFSISNPGAKGNLFGAAVISQPNAAILRLGEIKKRVIVVDTDAGETMAIHPVLFAALTYDHRIIDGVLANNFLWRVGEILRNGEFAP